jgi:hypothetical protein
MRKIAGIPTPVLAVLGLAALVSGCASPADPAAEAPSSTPTPTPSATGLPWPAGSDENTPECQDASAATLAVVNAAVQRVVEDEGAVPTTLPWLSARPDRDLGAWTLTGLATNAVTDSGTEGGYLVVWATRDDPTSPTFGGEIFTVGGSAGLLARLPPLQPGYVGSQQFGEDAPPEALSCGSQRAR